MFILHPRTKDGLKFSFFSPAQEWNRLLFLIRLDLAPGSPEDPSNPLHVAISPGPHPCLGFFLAFQKTTGNNLATSLDLFSWAKNPPSQGPLVGAKQECHLVGHLGHCQQCSLGRGWGGGGSSYIKGPRVSPLPGTIPRQLQELHSAQSRHRQHEVQSLTQTQIWDFKVLPSGLQNPVGLG